MKINTTLNIRNSKYKSLNTELFSSVYEGKKVLVTGHTGFKGSWLVYWLRKLGAEVCGYSLTPPTNPNHFKLLGLDIRSEIADIRNLDYLKRVLADFEPDIVFHLAAQPLVRLSYKEPIETLETNILGTANLLEACRHISSIKAIVNITSDKCYENKEWIWGYRENDPMGGYDPYSVSKGCAELIANSYRNSFFNLKDYGVKHHTLLASCRAGNVIGGGDWAEDRLIPDIMKAASQGKEVEIRNPYATRPWEHVLEPLSGYLQIGQKLLECKKEFAEGWNFGPGDQGNITVGEVTESFVKYWEKIKFNINKDCNAPHEAGLLKLDCSKAHCKLNWKDVWSAQKTFKRTVNWYKNYYDHGKINTDDDLNSYICDAEKKSIEWTK
jgi:CDP-glucose 4,6-dehydratase